VNVNEIVSLADMMPGDAARGYRQEAQQGPEVSKLRSFVFAKAVLDAREADEVREYTERENTPPAEGFGSLADKLRGAFERKP